MKTYYLVYKLTNLVNGKIYIGCHMTKNLEDCYMGSGKRIGYAKKKYGIENFKKEILSSHETPEEMLAEEKRLVNEEFLERDDVYNLICGGLGSWFYVNLTGKGVRNLKNPEIHAKTIKNGFATVKHKCETDPEYKKFRSALASSAAKCSKKFLDKNHTEASKKMISASMQGKQDAEKNSQFGTRWICKEDVAKKIKHQDLEHHLKDGWSRGRKTIAIVV